MKQSSCESYIRSNRFYPLETGKTPKKGGQFSENISFEVTNVAKEPRVTNVGNEKLNNTKDSAESDVIPVKVQKKRGRPGMSLTSDEIDNDFVDEYRVSIPNKKEEFLIPGKCVQTNSIAVNELIMSYANLLNVDTDELQIWGIDLSKQFDAIRSEFSVARFREQVLEDASGFIFPDEVLTRDSDLYATSGHSISKLVTR